MEIKSAKRHPHDYYQTPYSITQQLLDYEDFTGSILEPSAGNGAIVQVLEKYYSDLTAKDKEEDFFKETEHYHNIITNPPFSLAKDFILQAKRIATSKIALLLPLVYLTGKQRFESIWQDKSFPLAKIYVFTRYIWLTQEIRNDGKYESHGINSLAWFVWEREWKGETILRWIDNGEFVLKKSDPP